MRRPGCLYSNSVYYYDYRVRLHVDKFHKSLQLLCDVCEGRPQSQLQQTCNTPIETLNIIISTHKSSQGTVCTVVESVDFRGLSAFYASVKFS